MHFCVCKREFKTERGLIQHKRSRKYTCEITPAVQEVVLRTTDIEEASNTKVCDVCDVGNVLNELNDFKEYVRVITHEFFNQNEQLKAEVTNLKGELELTVEKIKDLKSELQNQQKQELQQQQLQQLQQQHEKAERLKRASEQQSKWLHLRADQSGQKTDSGRQGCDVTSPSIQPTPVSIVSFNCPCHTYP